jgi:RNA polymerase sigma-70 factor (ECF subfamily)
MALSSSPLRAPPAGNVQAAVTNRPGSVTSSAPGFRAVYDEYFDFVWRSLRRLGVREADAMDATQSVFLTIHLRLGSFEGRSQLRTWIFGICMRVASDHRRSAPVRREVITDHVDVNLGSTARDADPLVKAESRQAAAIAESILNQLPEEQRVAFVLFELEELSAEEIAVLMDAPVGTIRSRLRLAREALHREAKRLTVRTPTGQKDVV